MKKLLGVGLASLAVFLICLEIIVANIGLEDINIFNILWLQYFIALVGFLIMAQKIKFRWPKLKKNKYWIILSSILKLGNVYFFYKSLFYLFPDIVSVTSLSGDLFVIIGGVLFLREAFKWNQKFGLLIVLLGLGMYFYRTFNEFSEETLNIGLLYLVIAQLCWAGYLLIQKILISKEIPPCNLNFFTFLFVTIMLTPMVNFQGYSIFEIETWILVAITGIITLYTFTLILKAFQYIDANKVSVILSANPFITVILVYLYNLIGTEKIELSPFGLTEFLGGVILIGGIILSNWKFKDKKNPL
ncbi:DMT family transporter [Aureivirga sp. CE67]|uniref:DMT family transporter n=1 Tax=Aureivirga sp. CE67 TaxID=1788983 RepID=UPI0018CA04AA|nr:DMT family transporter [Aureivirga sp. CE67]